MKRCQRVRKTENHPSPPSPRWGDMTVEQLRARHRAYLVSGAIILAFAVLVFETAPEPLIERVMFLQTETLLVLMVWRQTAWVSFLRMMDRDTGPAQGARG